jgi:hypothetical protein
MSALCQKGDQVHRSKVTLLDNLVSGDAQRLRHRDAELERWAQHVLTIVG